MVLDPSLDNADVATISKRIVTCVLMNFWPRMCSSTPEDRRLAVDVYVDGDLVELPSPEDFPPLDLYARALASLKDGAGSSPVTRYSKELGRLSIKSGLKSERHQMTDAEATDVLTGSSHIALMRPVELVVRYLPGQPYPDERYEWAGVFVCSEEERIEAAFADSEPPTHDDWMPENLQSTESKAMVKLTMQKLKKEANDFTRHPSQLAGSKSSSPSLAATAGKMGRFLAPVSTKGPGFPVRKSSRLGPASRLRVSPPEFVGLSVGEDGGTVATFEAELHNDGSTSELCINASPRLVADGAKASDRDVPRSFLPRAIGIALPQHSIAANGGMLKVGKLSGTLFIRTTVPTGTAIEIEVGAVLEAVQ